MDSLDAYAAATGRNVTVLPPGTIFAYDWHRVRPSYPEIIPLAENLRPPGTIFAYYWHQVQLCCPDIFEAVALTRVMP